MAEWVDWVRAAHILFAVLWAGGAVFVLTVVGPALRAAGPAAGGFMGAVFRRGGFSVFFAPVGVLAVVTGGILYGQYKVHAAMDSAYGIMITAGAVLAVLALLDGFIGILPMNRRLVALARGLKGPPTPDQQATMMALGERLGKRSAMSAMAVAAALLFMLLARLV